MDKNQSACEAKCLHNQNFLEFCELKYVASLVANWLAFRQHYATSFSGCRFVPTVIICANTHHVNNIEGAEGVFQTGETATNHIRKRQKSSRWDEQ